MHKSSQALNSSHTSSALLCCLWLLVPSHATAAEPSLAYVVRPSDKLILLAKELLLSPDDWPDIAKFNGLPNPNLIRVGQTVNIPVRLAKFAVVSGKVLRLQGDVQVAGTKAVVDGLVREGDMVSTGPDSNALVQLADGSRVTIQPNSLAQIETSRSYGSSRVGGWFSGLLRLTQGAVEALASKATRRATPLAVTTPTATIGVRGTEFRVAYENLPGRNARAEVLEGKVLAENTTQRSAAPLEQGFGAVIDPLVKDVKVVALLSAPDLAGSPVNIFKPAALWPMPVLVGASSFRLQISGDENFATVARNMIVDTPSADLSSVANGAWFVKLRGIDGNFLEGYDSTKAVQIVLPPPPEPGPPRQWTLSSDRLDIQSGRHYLQFVQSGLDSSHEINATVTKPGTPLTPLARVTARGSVPTIALDLGLLDAGVEYELRLEVTQADGAKVIPLAFKFTGISGWGWYEGILQPLTIAKP